MKTETEGAPVMFAPLTEEAAAKIMDAVERLKKLPSGFRWKDHEGNVMIDSQVEKALKADPTGIAAALMVMARAKDAGEDIGFTANEVLAMTPKDLEMLRNLKTLRELCQAPDLDGPITAFQNAIKSAAIQYGLLSADVEALIDDRTKLAHVRTSALWCIDNFAVHQFNQGAKSHGKFHYNVAVHEFNNVNSAIRITATQPLEGVTMALIRDPEIGEYSYFIFILRSGENITVLTDKPAFDNPEQKFMRRKPGRDLEQRLESNFFPYGVLDIKVDNRGDIYIPKDTGGKLVVYQTEAIKLCDLSTIGPAEIVWALLMFDLITQRYHRENRHTKQLSYTAEMLRVPMALHAGTQLSLRGYKQLDVDAITLDQVTTDAMAKRWGCKPTRFNQWMEERYGPMVNPEIFNVLEKPDHKMLTLGNSESAGALTPYSGKDRRFMSSDEQPVNYAISHLPAESFGTKTEILKDYKWTARKNLAVAIQALADEEFEREKLNVVSWYRKAVRANMPALRRAIWQLELNVPSLVDRFEKGFEIRPVKTRTKNILSIFPAKDWSKTNRIGHREIYCVHSGGWSGVKKGWYCLEEQDTIASTLAVFRPTTPEGIAVLAGCEVNDLPVGLRNWYEHETYHGNQILNDVDPLECELHNPWMHDNWREGISPTVIVAFSKKALKRWVDGDGMNAPLPPEPHKPAWVRKLKRGDYVQTKHSAARFWVGRISDDWFDLYRNGRRSTASLEDLIIIYEPSTGGYGRHHVDDNA